MKFFLSFIVVSLVFLSSCTTSDSSRNPSSLFSATDLLTPEQMDKISSSKNLRLKNVDILTDNDDAFDEKMSLIKEARSGDTIRLAYYIYSHDHTSSLMTQELLAAAKRGVRVQMLLDFFINYGDLDKLLLLEKLSAGKIQVRFYGKPTDLMIRDARFLTLPCPQKSASPKATECSNAKWAEIAKSQNMDVYSRLLLTAIYTRNLDLLKIAIMGGQEIDLATFKMTHNWTPESNREVAMDLDLESIFANLKLLKSAKIDGNYLARLKIALGLLVMGDKLNPLLYEVFGRLPLDQVGAKSWQDWLHFTDYTHHKLLLLGDRKVVLGGRNIEDSYHMKKNPLTKKYIFKDVDLSADISAGGKDLVSAFDRLWNYQPLVWSAAEAYRQLPHDWHVNADWFKTSLESCQTHVGKSRNKLSQCLNSKIGQKGYQKMETRQAQVVKDWQSQVDILKQQYVRKGSERRFRLSAQEAEKMSAYYLENLPFSLVDKNKTNQDRIYGASKRSFFPWGPDREELNGKNIQAAWLKEMEHVCEVSRQTGQEKRIIFHNAYYLPPASLIRAFGKMMDGSWNCKNVKVTIVTNSDQSTDLFFINIFARYQLKAMFDTYRRKGTGTKSAKFEYLEYKGADNTGGKVSLHSKVSVFGDDILVGSANLDVRSFYMDTNNGILLRDVPQLAKSYSNWIDDLTYNSGMIEDKTKQWIRGVRLESLQAQDWGLLKSYIEKLSPKLTQGKNGEFLKALLVKISNHLHSLSSRINDAVMIPDDSDHSNKSNKAAEQNRLEVEYDELLQLL